jgi:hypothetical protein
MAEPGSCGQPGLADASVLLDEAQQPSGVALRASQACRPVQQPVACRLIPPALSWPHALRAVSSWLTPAITLTRWWQAWSKAPPPTELRHLLNTVSAGHGLYLKR